MDDLISRKALAEWVHAYVPADTPDALITKSFIMAALSTKSITPSVPAVPLDKLCEWLQENASLKSGTLISAVGWKYALIKWMEEQDAAD